MRSTFTGIEIAKRALFAQQAGLQTTGHNIANSNTKGYSRQVVHMTAARPLEAVGLQRTTHTGQIGQGVEVNLIQRVREQFLDDQYYNENKSLGDWALKTDSLAKLESIFNEPSDTGISKVIQKFWTSWTAAANDPESITARASLKESSIALTDAFNMAAKQLSDLKTDLTTNINANITDINTMIDSVAALNKQIFRVEALGNDANDLRDQRNLILDQLSGLININVTETDHGYTVRMGDTTLVEGVDVVTQFDEASLESEMLAGNLTSGELHGMFHSRDNYVTSYQYQLDSMVSAIAEGDIQVTLSAGTVIPEGMTVGGVTYTSPPGDLTGRTLTTDTTVTVRGLNGLHELGYSMTDPPTAGTPFFTLKSGYTSFSAESIQVNPDIVSQPSKIAVSGKTYIDPVSGTEKVVQGNNDVGLLVVGLRSSKFSYAPSAGLTPVLDNGTLDDFFRSLVGQLGVQSKEAQRQTANQASLVQNVDSRRMSVSGVSLDEEMANLIKYQQSYAAAARAMTTFDEALDKVINGMGLVGR